MVMNLLASFVLTDIHIDIISLGIPIRGLTVGSGKNQYRVSQFEKIWPQIHARGLLVWGRRHILTSSFPFRDYLST